MKRIQLLILFSLLSFAKASSQSGAFIYSKYVGTGSASVFWNETTFPLPTNGKAYSYRSADTITSDWNNLILSIFKFSPSNYFPNVVDSIKTQTEFTFDDSLNTTFNSYFTSNPNQAFKQLNPVKYYSFQLQQITDTAFTTFTPKTGPAAVADTEICFFIVPGSGDNQTSAIVRNEGYHNLNCNVMSTLKKHGDIYVFTKPNEDFRTIRIKQLPNKKMVTDLYPTDSYMNQYLISNYKHEGINYLIECVAAIKQLKKKYKKVFVLGCSQGGYSALYASLETEVDGVLISSGYSVKLDDNYLQFGNMAQKFAQLPFELVKDSIKKRIRTQKSCYYFSWPTNDSPIYLAENQLHHTQNYFGQGSPLTNVKYLYTYANHAFPPCVYIDSFVNEVKDKPKAFITDTLNTCLYDSMVRKVEFLGQAPFTYSLFKNDTLVGTYTTNTKTDTITIFEEGTYQIKNIISATSSNGIWSDKIIYQQTPHAVFQLVSTNYLCDSSKRQLNLNFQGTSPFHLTVFTKDVSGTMQLESDQWFTNNNATLLRGNNKYYFEFNDAVACELKIDSLLIEDTALHYQPISEQYNCLLHKSEFTFSLSGASPYNIEYLKDGILQTQNETNSLITWQLENANYVITKITDAHNCDTISNHFIPINYDSLTVVEYTPEYDCANDQFKMAYDIVGNSPFTLNYINDTTTTSSTFSSNNIELFLSHINFQPLSIIDATGCLFQLSSTNYSFNSDTLEFSFSVPIYDCDSNKTKIHFELEGNPPFTIFYKKNGIDQTIHSTSPSFDYWFENGNYLIQKLEDVYNCSKDTDQYYVFNSTPIQAEISQHGWNCDSSTYQIDFLLSGKSPWQIYYHDIGSNYSLITSDSLHSLFLMNGIWELDSIVDANQCQTLPSLTTFNLNYQSLQASLSPASYNCDSNKNQVLVSLQGIPPFTIHYFKDYISAQFNTSSTSFDWLLTNGNYLITQIADATGCTIDTSIGYVLNSQPLSATITNDFYNCDSSKYQIDFSITGNPPYELSYTNGISNYTEQITTNSYNLFLPNGAWTIQEITDASGCHQVLNTIFNVNYTPLAASIVSQIYSCDSSKLKVQFNLVGNSPWIIHSLKNGSIPTHLYDTTTNPNYSSYLSNGNYSFLEVTDANGCVAWILENAINNIEPLSAQLNSQQYSCDSNKLFIQYALTGDGPWNIAYKNLITGVITNSSTTNSTWNEYLTTGHYAFLTVSDANCTTLMHDTIHNEIEPLSAFLDTIELICDSSSYRINVVAHGGSKPYHINYFKDGQLITVNTNSDTTQINLSNANYFFVDIVDAQGCSITFNKAETILYNSFSLNGISSTFLCDKNLNSLQIDIQHTTPVWLVYLNANNVLDTIRIDQNNTLEVANGKYMFTSLYDSLGCIDTFHYSIQLDNQPIGIDSIRFEKNCDDRNYNIQFYLKGHAPWTLFYNYNNIQDTLEIPITNYVWTTNPGEYFWIELFDSNNCKLPILVSDTLNDFLPELPLLSFNRIKLQATSGASIYKWFKDNQFMYSTSDSSIISEGNGEYYVELYDIENCKYTTNKITIDSGEGITVFPNPINENTRILVNDQFGKYWDYKIVDMQGNTIEEGSVSQSSKNINLSHLQSGIYNIIITYESDFTKHILRITKY